MLMKKSLLVFTVLLFGVLVAGAQSGSEDSNPPVTIPHTESFLFSSTTTGLDYQIFVSLPEDYDMTRVSRTYPVIYLLDANYYFGAINDFIRVENLVQELPKVIVVGIGYPENPLQGRVTDMLENPSTFLEFISDELIPFVDENYKTRTNERTIVGHSLGGQFVLFTLFNRVDLFQSYIAASPGSPSWRSMIQIEADFADENSSLPVRLFMSASEQELVEIEPMFSAIESRNYEGLALTFFNVEDATHVSSAIPAFTYGLRYVFR